MIAFKELVVVLNEPESLSAERYRSMRTNIERVVSGKAPVLAVVSTWPREGKSSISANLAAAYAQIRSGAILIDGDLRRCTLSRLLGQESRSGLADCLHSGAAALGSRLCATDIPGLSFLPAGQSDQNPADLLTRDPLAQVMRALRDREVPVLIDTPPLSACSDALLLGEHCDGAILVVHSRTWDGEPEVQSKQALESHRIRILGVVLNHVQDNASRYYGPNTLK